MSDWCMRVVECHTAVQVASSRERRHARQSRCLPHLPEQDWADAVTPPWRRDDVTTWWRISHESKTEPEMYEFVCRTADERRVWIQTLRDAIISCSQEGWAVNRVSYRRIIYANALYATANLSIQRRNFKISAPCKNVVRASSCGRVPP